MNEGEQAQELSKALLTFCREEGLRCGFGPNVAVIGLLHTAVKMALMNAVPGITTVESLAGMQSLFKEIAEYNAKNLITADEFRDRWGFEPKQDDLQRVNCASAGKLLHMQCGVCPHHDKPRFLCGCIGELAS